MPIKKLPQCFTVGREVREEDLKVQAAFSSAHDGPSRSGETRPTKGQILWIRSISRLQQQVCVSIVTGEVIMSDQIRNLSHDKNKFQHLLYNFLCCTIFG